MMNPRLQHALDYIEAHLGDPLVLADIAAAANLSSYHFARLFRAAIGRAPMDYVRKRRLTEAVLTLRADTGVSISDLAHQYGFESHQGFTTAFKREFQIPPVLYRSRLFPLPIQEKITMTEHRSRVPDGPDYRTIEGFAVMGMAMEFTQHTKAGIPELWTRFSPHIGQLPGQQGFTTYGVCQSLGDGNFNYIAGVQVKSDTTLPAELADRFVICPLPASCYAVFTHNGSLDFLQDTLSHIFGSWAPEHNGLLTGTPDFERYDERFDPQTRTGALEYWVPVKTPGDTQ